MEFIYLFICISHSEIPITKKISVSLTFSTICYNKYENYIQFNRRVASDNGLVILWDTITCDTVIVHWTRYRMYCPHASRKVKDNSKLIRYSRFKIPPQNGRCQCVLFHTLQPATPLIG